MLACSTCIVTCYISNLVPPTGTEPIKENTAAPPVGTPPKPAHDKASSLSETNKTDTIKTNYCNY